MCIMEKDLYMGVMLHTELFYAIIPAFFPTLCRSAITTSCYS